ncbi:MAG: glycosyltransferase family 4 protein [Pseudomonadota bacterium]
MSRDEPSREALRVAIVLETSGGGSGRHALDLAGGLAQRGCDVTVIYATARAEPGFVTALEALDGVRTVKAAMHRSVGLHDARDLLALGRLLAAHGPFDVTHAHSSKAGALLRLLPRRFTGKRIYTPHAFRTMDPELRLPLSYLYGGIERLLGPRADRVIAVSSAEADHARALGLSDRRLRTVVNGVRPGGFASRAEARALIDVPDDTVVVGFIGRLARQKDPLRFIDALNIAHQKNPKILGVIAGDGELMDAACAAAAPGAARFLGFVSGMAIFQGFDLFAMTSRYEAMPYTLLEALQAGLPIVSTEVGGVPETVEPNSNGVVVSLDATPEEFAEALLSLASDEGRRAAFADASRALAQERTVDRMVDETITIYLEASRA